MRSQQEILEKIDGIAKILYKLDPKKDPFFQQYRILVHKLTWENARHFLTPADYTEENKIEWNKNNILDKKILMEEIKEQVDIGAMHVEGNDVELAFNCATGLLAQFWLLGPIKDKILTSLFKDYMSQTNIYMCCSKTFEDISNELGFNWERMRLQYKGGLFSKMTDKYGKHFKMKMEEEIENKNTEEVSEQ